MTFCGWCSYHSVCPWGHGFLPYRSHQNHSGREGDHHPRSRGKVPPSGCSTRLGCTGADELVKPGIESECTTRALAAVPCDPEDPKDSPISTTDPQTTDKLENPVQDYEDPSPDAEAQSISEGETSPVPEFDFEDSLFSPPGPSKMMLTRSQKRAARHEHSISSMDNTPPNQFQTLDISADQLHALQEVDPTLEEARMIADGVQSAAAGQEFH